MLSRQRAFTLTAAFLCLAASPATAQYKVFSSDGVEYTDVMVDSIPLSLAVVEDFEHRCNIQAAAGNWWVDSNGNMGLMGGPAIYNTHTCRALGQSVSAGRSYTSGDVRQPQRTTSNKSGTCTSFSGGSICSFR
jgi:hypothetical protein